MTVLPGAVRKNRLCSRALMVCLLMISAGFSHADTYQVELILFKQNSVEPRQYRWNGEPDVIGALDLATGDLVEPFADPLINTTFLYSGSESTSGVDSDPVTPLKTPASRFQQLGDDEYLMKAIHERLRRSSEYQPLLHLSWLQETMAFGDIQPILIQAGEVVSRAGDNASYLYFSDSKNVADIHELDGTFAFERSRFLHFRVDLALHVPRDSITARQDQLNNIDLAPTGNYRTYRMQERRQIKDEELHYFDHNLFGAVARIIKIEPDQTAALP